MALHDRRGSRSLINLEFRTLIDTRVRLKIGRSFHLALTLRLSRIAHLETRFTKRTICLPIAI